MSSFPASRTATSTPMAQFNDGAHNFDIAGAANFLNAQNINYGYGLPPTDDPVEILHRARAIEAAHTSDTAVNADKCKPGTRGQVIADITNWILTPQERILWFHGPAGAGKTCVMRDVVLRCEEELGLVAASYFFSTRGTGLEHKRPFVATIAHQLICAIPTLDPLVYQAISRRRTIFDESLDLQMDALIIKPLQTIPAQKIVIAVDGFDECREKSERKHLFRLFRTLVDKVPSLVVVLASRPELDIRTEFDSTEFKAITKVIQIQDYGGKLDVAFYYSDEFERIRKTHPMKFFIPKDWPVQAVRDILLDKSSGHFIFPSVLIKHLDNPRQNPVALLERVLAQSSSPSSKENPFADLDALYGAILHSLEADLGLVKRLLHSVIGIQAVDNWSGYRSPSFFENLFQLPSGTVDITLCDLHSVLSIPSPDSRGLTDSINFHHKSLEDYLVTPSRSEDLFQSSHETHIDLTIACARIVQGWASNPENVLRFPASYPIWHWRDHLRLASKDNPTSLPKDILEFDPRNIWKCSFVEECEVSSIEDAQKAFHASMCTLTCRPLCKLLLHMNQCHDAANAFIGPLRSSEVQRTERLGMLPQLEGILAFSPAPPQTRVKEVVAPVDVTKKRRSTWVRIVARLRQFFRVR